MLTSGFDVNEIMQVGWFRFMQEIVRNGNNFLLYALFDLELMKSFECRSDVCMLRNEVTVQACAF